MLDQTRDWIKRHLRGKLSDPVHHAGLVERGLYLAYQFSILHTDADARSFFEAHSAPIVRASHLGKLDFGSVVAEVYSFASARGIKVPKTTSPVEAPTEERDLFGARPVRSSKVAARSPSSIPASSKSKLSDQDFIEETALFGRSLGILPNDAEEENFKKHSERALRDDRVEDTSSSTPELLARYLQELSGHRGFGV